MKKSTKITLGVVAGVAVVGLGVVTALSLANETDPTESLITAQVERQTISATVAASGEVQAVEQRGVNFAVAGEVTAVNVEAGDTVAEGQVLATVDSTALEVALEAAESSVASALDGVSAANVAEAQAQQAINTADQAIAAAQQAIENAKDGVNTGGNDKEAEATANRQLAAAQAQRDTAEYSKARVPAQKAAASAALASARAGLEQAQANLEKASLRSPMAGTVLAVSVEDGDSVTSAGPDAFLVADLSGFEVVADFAESDVVLIEEGQSVQIEFDAIAGSGGAGTVTEVSPLGAADPTGGSLTTYTVTVEVATPPAGLRVGMTAQIDIIVEEDADVVAAPVAALNVSGDDVVVNVLQSDGTIREVVVTTGTQGGNFVEITSGLEGGETVVIGDVGEFPVVNSDEEFDPGSGPPPGVEQQQRQQDTFRDD